MACLLAYSRYAVHLRSFLPVSVRISSSSARTETRKRGCPLCDNNLHRFGYKDVLLLRQFLSRDGMIYSRRQTRICPKMQNKVAKAIKRSRKMGLLPNFSRPQLTDKHS